MCALKLYCILINDKQEMTKTRTNHKNLVTYSACFILTSCFMLYALINILFISNDYFQDSRSNEHFHNKRCFKINWKKRDMIDMLENGSIRKQHVNSYRSTRCTRLLTITPNGGRTGNQMFLVAALFGIAFDYDFLPIVSPSFPLLKYFALPNIYRQLLRNSIACNPPLPGVYFKCFNGGLSSNITNMTLYDQFQSWKYFINAERIIRKIFQLKPHFLERANTFLKTYVKKGHKAVCIHVRRGDMNTADYKKKGVEVANTTFIYKAMTFCRETFKDVHFIVLSNEMSWCKTNIKETVTFSDFEEPGYDLALMSLCEHVVVTSGSFGWWGAWLSNGTAVYFKGYIREGSWQASRVNREDYYPPDWIGL